jgi:hypothetical protein
MAKNRRIQHVEREADPYAKDDHSTANEILKDRKRQALQHYYHTLEQGSDGNGNGKKINAQYSHYVAIDQASGGIIEKLSGINRGIDQESGNAVYYVTKADGTNLLVTEKDAQNIAIRNANRNLTGTKHVFDILAAEDVSALPNAVLSDTKGEDDVVDWSKLKSKIYSKNSVDMSSGHQNLVVREDLPNEVLRRIITNTDSEKGI